MLAESRHKALAWKQSAENHRSCNCNGIFAANKYPGSPWRVVMSKDSVGIRYKRGVKSGRVLPSFLDTRKSNIVVCTKMRNIFVENICRQFFQKRTHRACKIT